MSTRTWIAAMLLAGSLSGVADAATRRVPQQYPSIQAAVDAARPGDTVLVGPGHYVENVLIQKSLKLRSVGGASVTTIDGNGIGAPLAALGTLKEDVSISGFTLTGGAFILEEVLVPYPNYWGSGLFVDSFATANVFDNVVVANRGCGGSGIRSSETNLRIHDNVVTNNQPMEWCPSNGEAMRLAGSGRLTRSLTAQVERNAVTANGGMGIWMVAFDEFAVRGNTVTDNGYEVDEVLVGGGMDIGMSGGVIADNLVARNVGEDAPALRLMNFPDIVRRVLVTGNRFIDNQANASSGGVWLTAYPQSVTYFVGNQIVGDSAGDVLRCDGGGVVSFANIVVNRNPAGTPNCGQ